MANPIRDNNFEWGEDTGFYELLRIFNEKMDSDETSSTINEWLGNDIELSAGKFYKKDYREDQEGLLKSRTNYEGILRQGSAASDEEIFQDLSNLKDFIDNVNYLDKLRLGERNYKPQFSYGSAGFFSPKEKAIQLDILPFIDSDGEYGTNTFMHEAMHLGDYFALRDEGSPVYNKYNPNSPTYQDMSGYFNRGTYASNKMGVNHEDVIYRNFPAEFLNRKTNFDKDVRIGDYLSTPTEFTAWTTTGDDRFGHYNEYLEGRANLPEVIKANIYESIGRHLSGEEHSDIKHSDISSIIKDVYAVNETLGLGEMILGQLGGGEVFQDATNKTLNMVRDSWENPSERMINKLEDIKIYNEASSPAMDYIDNNNDNWELS